MQADLAAKLAAAKTGEERTSWKTPRHIAILTGVLAAIVAVPVGIVCYKFGQRLSVPQPWTIIFQPGAIVVTLPMPPPTQ